MVGKSPCLPLVLAACIVLGGPGCSHFSGRRGKIHEARVTVRSCAINDLGQVMIFATDNERNEMIFVRDFYERGKSRKELNRDMKAYLRSVESLRGRKVSILYFINEAGSLEIDSIREK